MLRENFGRFKLCRLLVRPPNPQAVFLEQIHNAERERIVRPDDGEFDFLLLREREQFRQIICADVDALDGFLRFLRSLLFNSRIARRAPNL
jgi:hypothetical protein